MKRVRTTFGADISQTPDILAHPKKYALVQYEPDSSLFDTFRGLIEKKCIFIIDNELVYAHDLRCDIVTKEIYFLYLKGVDVPIPSMYKERFEQANLLEKYYDYVISLNQTLTKYVIWRKGEFMTDKLYFLLKTHDGTFGTCELKLYKFGGLHDNCTSAGDLFKLYVKMSYGFNNEPTYHLYWGSKRTDLSHVEQLIYDYIGRRGEFKQLGSYKPTTSLGFARNSAYELSKHFSDDELSIGVSYYIRRLEFELAVIEGSWSGTYWDGWTQSNIENLISGKHYFCKYSKGKYSLIFRKEWL